MLRSRCRLHVKDWTSPHESCFEVTERPCASATLCKRLLALESVRRTISKIAKCFSRTSVATLPLGNVLIWSSGRSLVIFIGSVERGVKKLNGCRFSCTASSTTFIFVRRRRHWKSTNDQERVEPASRLSRKSRHVLIQNAPTNSDFLCSREECSISTVRTISSSSGFDGSPSLFKEGTIAYALAEDDRIRQPGRAIIRCPTCWPKS